MRTLLPAGFGLLAAATAGCSTVDNLINPVRPVTVIELRRTPDCRTTGPESQLHYFADADAVRAWEIQRGVQLTGGTELPRGPYVVVELGERKMHGYGVVVSRDAAVHRNDLLALNSTFIYTVQVGPDARHGFASPCVLLQLPPRSYRTIELYDQDGVRRAHTRIGAPPAPPAPEAPLQQPPPPALPPETPTGTSG